MKLKKQQDLHHEGAKAMRYHTLSRPPLQPRQPRRTCILNKDSNKPIKESSSVVCYALLNTPLLPGKAVAHNLGLLCLDTGLPWAIVAHYFGLLGIPGISCHRGPPQVQGGPPECSREKLR